MNINFNLGNRRGAQINSQMNVYDSIINNQKLLAHALKENAARQHVTPVPVVVVPAPAPVVVVPAPAPVPVPVVVVPAPAPVPAPVVVVPAPAPAPVRRLNKKSKFNNLLSKMNEQRKK